MKKIIFTLLITTSAINNLWAAALNYKYHCQNQEKSLILNFEAAVDTQNGWNTSFANNVTLKSSASKKVFDQFRLYAASTGIELQNKIITIEAKGSFVRKNFWRQYKFAASLAFKINQAINSDGSGAALATGIISQVVINKPQKIISNEPIICSASIK